MNVIKTILAGAVFAAVGGSALAEDIEQAKLDQILAAAAKGYSKPAEAKIRNVHKSLAVNGTGFCGEITVEAAPETYTTFHVLLETANGPSVLRLSDFGAPTDDPQSATVNQMMHNFGCITD
jgi:hypothetical protein